MASFVRKSRNLMTSNLHISKYIFQAISNQIINRKDEISKRRRALKITAHNSSAVLRGMNVKIDVELARPDLFDRNYFMVCNHMSYLDILVLSSQQPACFVTSVEMEKTFFLGDMAKWGGSFFVDRVNRRKMKAEVEALTQLLHQNFNVFIFPEGTSTNGQKILPFKKSLFRVPFQAQLPILPICLKYTHINGEPFSEQNCDKICWYDDMTFGPHFLQMMGLKELKVKVDYMEPLLPQSFENHGELCAAAQERIEQAYYTKQ